MKRGTLAAMLLSLWMANGLLQAADFPAHVQNELPEAQRLGEGGYHWFGLKIYHAVLWVDKSGYQPIHRGSGKLILDLRYTRSLNGERIAESSIDEIRNLGLGTPVQHTEWLGMLKALFPDVHEGTQISGVYLPAQGARFYLNGRVLGEINDAEFAQAFFSIWLDERTSASKLRSQLLDQRS